MKIALMRRWLSTGGLCVRVILGAVLMNAQRAAAGDEAWRGWLDAQLASIVNDPQMPLASLSVLAVREGRVVYQRQLGNRWIDNDHPDRSKPADARTLYRIASISKLVTTLGVMRLVEEGKLDLDADVSGYLGFRLRNPHFADRAITLRMMLSHTSSLRDSGGYYWDSASGITLADVLVPGGKAYGKGEMWATNAPPGDYFQYANLPWGVIGAIMERVTGERFDRLMRRLVLDPLNLSGGFSPADFSAEELSNVATLYRKRSAGDDDQPWNPSGAWMPQTDDFSAGRPSSRAAEGYVPGTNGTLFGPQGNCRLSAEGLSRIMLMLMNGGELDGRRVLSAKSVEQMLAIQWRADAARQNGNAGGEFTDSDVSAMNAWGLGVQHFLDITGPGRGDRLVEPGGFAAVGHMGDAYGLTSAMVFNREKRNGLIFLVGGVGADPSKTRGEYSAMIRYEERILTALHRGAILQRGG